MLKGNKIIKNWKDKKDEWRYKLKKKANNKKKKKWEEGRNGMNKVKWKRGQEKNIFYTKENLIFS